VSEQARIAYLQEQMNEVKRTIDQNPFIVFVTMLLGGICFVAASHFYGLTGLTVGLVMFTVFMNLRVYSARKAKDQYNKLLEQLKGLTFATLTCSNCKKEIPLGNYAYASCPFCGNSLKK
jgi:hypothetical protein